MQVKGSIFTILLFLFLNQALAADPAPAQDETPPNIPVSTVLQNLKMNGYEIVTKIELTKDLYNINVLTPQGKDVTVTMKAQSGEITSPKQNPSPQVTFAEAVKRVEGSGYHDITSISFSGDTYLVYATDPNNKKVKLKVNSETGEIK